MVVVSMFIGWVVVEVVVDDIGLGVGEIDVGGVWDICLDF